MYPLSLPSFRFHRIFCVKQYCECYQHSVHCGLNCRCTNCKNFPEAGGPGNGEDHPSVPSSTDPVANNTSGEVVGAVKENQGNIYRRVSLDDSSHHNHNYHYNNGYYHQQYQHRSMSSASVAWRATNMQGHYYHTDNSNSNQEEKKEDDGDATVAEAVNDKDKKNDKDTDRMAIMAAVAMTELLGTGVKGEATKSEESSEGETNIVSAETSPHRRRELEPEHPEATQPKKAKMEETSEAGDGATSPSLISMSTSTMDSSCPPMLPSPRSGQIHGLKPFPPHGRFPYTPGTPTTGVGPRYFHMYNRNMTPPPHFRHHPHHHPHRHPSMSSPPTKITPPLPHINSGGFDTHHKDLQHAPSLPSVPVRGSPTYEDVVRSSGLPKSLSFRKICSKCGKTRGEHGELGFGNKCVYQDCGKCGAGVQMHLKAGVPIGILCTLTVEQGAIPGASEKYERKIRELAARAELQKELSKRKHDAAERAVAVGAP